MATSGDGIGLLIGAGAFVYGAAKGAQANDAARTLEALRVEANRRIAGQQEIIRAREIDIEGLQSQLRTMTVDYAQAKHQLDATVAARVKDQEEYVAVRRRLDAQLVDLTHSVEIEHAATEQVRGQKVTLEAQVREGLERERAKDERITELEARIRELEGVLQ